MNGCGANVDPVSHVDLDFLSPAAGRPKRHFVFMGHTTACDLFSGLN